ncbi:MAG TPA: hypothetical protein VL025_11795, partial [Thermoanaerobaculia bacterium]|nr:hypothetical protein [Thermoanaerobaculia bacterium]
GSCVSAADPIPSSALRSLSYEPLTQRACEPVPPVVPEGGPPMPLGWGTFARMCRGEDVDSVCEDPGTTCVPTAEPPPPGFRQCVLYLGEGEAVCPADYPDRFTFYSSLDDSRGCTPCSCTETAPAQCEALVSTYQDASCNQLLNATLITESPSGCQDLAPGLTLGSMDATWVTKEPGACTPSGGVPFGEAIPINPKTFCCQPPPGTEG